MRQCSNCCGISARRVLTQDLQVDPLPLRRRVVRRDLLGRDDALVGGGLGLLVLGQPPGEVFLLGVRGPHDEDEVAGVGVHLAVELELDRTRETGSFIDHDNFKNSCHILT